jgi:hypothetical protein
MLSAPRLSRSCPHSRLEKMIPGGLRAAGVRTKPQFGAGFSSYLSLSRLGMTLRRAALNTGARRQFANDVVAAGPNG